MPVSSQWFANPGVTYEIEQSCRFNDGDSPYLNRSFVTPTSAANFGYSFWVKLGAGYNGSYIISADGSGNNDNFYFNSNKINIQEGGTPRLVSNQVFRDHASWYHFVVAYELGNSTNAHKLRVYLNGSEITSWSTDARSGFASTSSRLNANGVSHDIGANANNGVSTHVNNFDGYLAEFHFVDGTVITPSMFGETNSDGVWVPIEASPTYGNNGFYLAFQDSSALGDDTSGEGHDWSSSGLAAADKIGGDTPTTNACVMSPIDQYSNTLNLADGNLYCTPSTSAYCSAHGTFYVSSGKWVIECKHTTVFGEGIGFAQNGQLISGSAHRGFGMFADGRKFVNTSYTATGTGLSSGDYRYCFLDLDNNAMWFAHVDVSSSNALVYDNSATKAEIEAGTTTNAVHTSLPAGDYAPTVWMDTSGVIEMNFGQKDFITTSDLPSGFKKLNTANLDDPTIADPSAHFQTTLYAGNGSTQSITNGGNSDLQPDLVWIKNRSAADSNVLTDAVRGVTKILATDSTGAESTDADTVTAFNSDGFALGADDKVNTSSENYVSWQWKADSAWSESATGNILASSGRRNTTAGFSIASWTHQTSGNYAIKHGLSTTPEFFMTKSRDSTTNWDCWHKDLADTAKRLLMTGAAESTAYWVDASDSSDGSGSYGDIGSGESPVTASLFGFQHDNFSSTDDIIGYFWTGIEGYSSFTKYEGNGSADGPMVHLGHRSSLVVIKRIDAVNDWVIWDDKRNTGNPNGTVLRWDSSNAEYTGISDRGIDILSNGIKIRTTNAIANASGGDYVVMSWAQSPFKSARAR